MATQDNYSFGHVSGAVRCNTQIVPNFSTHKVTAAHYILSHHVVTTSPFPPHRHVVVPYTTYFATLNEEEVPTSPVGLFFFAKPCDFAEGYQ
jgi:hypothetical protein